MIRLKAGVVSAATGGTFDGGNTAETLVRENDHYETRRFESCRSRPQAVRASLSDASHSMPLSLTCGVISGVRCGPLRRLTTSGRFELRHRLDLAAAFSYYPKPEHRVTVELRPR